jgi:hypothetical protein
MAKVSNGTLVMEYKSYQNKVYQVTIKLMYKGSELTFDKILTTLGFLDVSNNAFQGSIPAATGELVLLDVLNMSHNSFTGPIPSQLGHLAQLEALDLSSNELSGSIPLQLASLFVRLISHQPTVHFSQNEPATSNQPAVLFSQNKSAPAISHQPNEQAGG